MGSDEGCFEGLFKGTGTYVYRRFSCYSSRTVYSWLQSRHQAQNTCCNEPDKQCNKSQYYPVLFLSSLLFVDGFLKTYIEKFNEIVR